MWTRSAHSILLVFSYFRVGFIVRRTRRRENQKNFLWCCYRVCTWLEPIFSKDVWDTVNQSDILAVWFSINARKQPVDSRLPRVAILLWRVTSKPHWVRAGKFWSNFFKSLSCAAGETAVARRNERNFLNGVRFVLCLSDDLWCMVSRIIKKN